MNFVILIILFILFKPGYDTNDDFGLCNLVNGSKGVMDAHIVYSNYLLGLIYVALYSITTAVPWYPVMHYAVLFSGYTAITYVLINILKHESAPWLVTAFMFVFSYGGYITMQFTRTAGVATAGGILLMLWVFDSDNKNPEYKWVQIISGGVIGCFGYMYRESQFLADGAIISAVGVIILLGILRKREEGFVRRILVIICTFVVFFGVIGGLSVIDKKAYESDEWQNYRTYNVARSDLYDHGFPEYSEYEEKYQVLGINENAKNYYRQWNHIDLDGDTMKEIGSWDEEENVVLNSFYVKKFIKTIGKGMLEKPFFYVFLISVLMWFIWGRKDWISIVGIAYAALVTTGLYWYMFSCGRYLKDRVDAGILLAVVIVVLWTFRNEKRLFSNKAGIIVAVIAFALVQFAWHDNWRMYSKARDAELDNNKTVALEIAQDKEHLYLNKAVGFSYSDAYDVFDAVPERISENLYTLGGWTAMMPLNQAKLGRYGIEIMYDDIINNDNVYIIDKDINTTIKYIEDYYCGDACAEPVKYIGDYPVYRIVSQEEK